MHAPLRRGSGLEGIKNLESQIIACVVSKWNPQHAACMCSLWKVTFPRPLFSVLSSSFLTNNNVRDMRKRVATST